MPQNITSLCIDTLTFAGATGFLSPGAITKVITGDTGEGEITGTVDARGEEGDDSRRPNSGFNAGTTSDNYPPIPQVPAKLTSPGDCEGRSTERFEETAAETVQAGLACRMNA